MFPRSAAPKNRKENAMLEELAKPISDLQAEIIDIWGRL